MVNQYRNGHSGQIVEAVRWTGTNWRECAEFVGVDPATGPLVQQGVHGSLVPLPHGVTAQEGWWIVKNGRGVISPYYDADFRRHYERVSPQPHLPTRRRSAQFEVLFQSTSLIYLRNASGEEYLIDRTCGCLVPSPDDERWALVVRGLGDRLPVDVS